MKLDENQLKQLRERNIDLEQRLLLPQEQVWSSLSDIHAELCAQLVDAMHADALVGAQSDVYRLVCQPKKAVKMSDGSTMLTGGERYRGTFDSWDALESWSSFLRDDGARFAFALTFRKEGRGVCLTAYSFTLALPRLPGLGLSTLRWDLDRSGRTHSSDGLQSHLHVHADVRLPSPQMRPAELLDLLLYRVGRVPKP